MTLAAVIARSKADREAWHYTSLEEAGNLYRGKNNWIASRPLDARNDEDGMLTFETENNHLVFLNGVWQPEHSHFQDLPSDVLQGNTKDGYCLTFAKQTGTLSPFLELLFLTAPGDNPAEANTKLQITLESGADLTLIERHVSLNGATPFAHVIENEIILEPKATLAHGKIVTPHSPHVHLARTRVNMASDTSYDNFALLGGGQPLRNEIDVTLAGERAECRLYGTMLLRGDEHADTTIRVVHAAPHTSSRQLYKSVIGGKARGVFQGKITVNEGAQRADGYQLCRALLLSDQAEMDAKPELQIYADDVKCSHGCTIGNLDEAALFYLRSRGINEIEARELLVEAFVNEIADEIPAPMIRDMVKVRVATWLNR